MLTVNATYESLGSKKNEVLEPEDKTSVSRNNTGCPRKHDTN